MYEIREIVDVEQRIAQANKNRIRGGLPVSESTSIEIKPRGKFELTDDQREMVKCIANKKGVQRAINLLKRGIDGNYIGKSMQRRMNPFEKEPPHFLYLACQLLMDGGFTKVELAKSFVLDESTSMSIKTAHSHVSITVPLLTEFGVMQLSNGRYELTIQGDE
tara:strand:- start:103880 stop:104368 length:489 start_codon:yes stop_codon:yes gene_type:complete